MSAAYDGGPSEKSADLVEHLELLEQVDGAKLLALEKTARLSSAESRETDLLRAPLLDSAPESLDTDLLKVLTGLGLKSFNTADSSDSKSSNEEEVLRMSKRSCLCKGGRDTLPSLQSMFATEDAPCVLLLLQVSSE